MEALLKKQSKANQRDPEEYFWKYLNLSITAFYTIQSRKIPRKTTTENFFFNFCIHVHNRKVGRNASVVSRRQAINSRMEQRNIARLGML